MPNPPGEPYTSPPLGEWFLVRVLTVIAGTPQTYTFEEWQLGGDGTWDTKTGGRVATEDNAGYTLPAADDSEQTLAVDDFAWARAAFGAANLVWEMVPAASGTEVDDSWKNVVRCASTANVTVSNPGTAVFDGVTMSTGDTTRNRRMLLKNQSTASQNGIYQFNGSSSALTRTSDADGTDEMVGAVVWVSEGTVNADTIWACTTDKTITVGSTSTVWVKIYPVAGFHAKLTATSGGFWSWTEVTLDGSGVETNGTLSGSSNATPLKVDGTNLANPVVDDRVWMYPSKQAGKYEFLPYGYASLTFPGLVSITTQTFNGVKTFDDQVVVNDSNTANVVAFKVKDGLSASPFTAITSAATWATTDSLVFNVFGSVSDTGTTATTNPGRIEANAELRLGRMTDGNASKNSQYVSTTYTSGDRIPNFKDHAGAYWQMAAPLGYHDGVLYRYSSGDAEWKPYLGTDQGDMLMWNPSMVLGAEQETGWTVITGASITTTPGDDKYYAIRVTVDGSGNRSVQLAELPIGGFSGVIDTTVPKLVTVVNGDITSVDDPP